MTDEAIDALTIGEVRRIAERAGEALRLLQSLNLGGGHGAQRDAATPRALGHETAPPASTDSPFPCAACGRVRPERPGEPVKNDVCDACGNRLPGVAKGVERVLNKPEERRHGMTTAIVDPLTPAERAAKMALPAFGPDGLPVEETET